MKPIFEEERQFFKQKTGIELPVSCWRKSSKIYLDCTCKKPLYTFKVQNKEIKITKDNTKLFEDYNQKSIHTLINIYENQIKELKVKSIDKTIEFIRSHPNHLYVVSHSGGKDSTVQRQLK